MNISHLFSTAASAAASPPRGFPPVWESPPPSGRAWQRPAGEIGLGHALTKFDASASPPGLSFGASYCEDLSALRGASFDGSSAYSADIPAISCVAVDMASQATLFWISTPRNSNEIRHAKESARSPLATCVVVGNEALIVHRPGISMLHKTMEESRSEIGKHVSTTKIIESCLTIAELPNWSNVPGGERLSTFSREPRPACLGRMDTHGLRDSGAFVALFERIPADSRLGNILRRHDFEAWGESAKPEGPSPAEPEGQP
jgi:hypothetical protein